MLPFNPPQYGVAYEFGVTLQSQSNNKIDQINPTLATGDVKISKDFGAFANLATLPTVSPAGGASVRVQLSATEMQASNIMVRFADAAGSEWCDLSTLVQPIVVTLWQGTAQAGGSSTITLDTGASATDNFYVPGLLVITGGTGKGQSRFITGYVGSTKVATLATAWATTPDSSSEFRIFPAGMLQSTMPTSLENADAVWDELRSGHVISGSFGENVIADATKINGSATAASKLASAANTMITGTITNTALTPTTTQFECSDITDATADLYKDRTAIIMSGSVIRAAKTITAYALTSGRGRFTVQTLPAAPSNADTVIIV